MPGLYLALVLTVIALNLAAATIGAYSWFLDRVWIAFWYLLRVAQLGTLVFVVTEFVLYLSGDKADDQLHYLYVVLPVVVSFLAEGMRAGAAGQELGEVDHHTLSPEEQEEVAMLIVRRENGIMTVAAAVTAFLIWRAAVTTAGMF